MYGKSIDPMFLVLLFYFYFISQAMGFFASVLASVHTFCWFCNYLMTAMFVKNKL